ncbi:uncharacterized protein LOC124269268 [Haliotis rubra]|uniref:uncharacterized protein LOC124269268 n=1 Tax=Haliotis rubra TaxID=36100 RepID=UPI001EE519C5|nr:uncharacterized protein LOC124269268 [Haliotis rubra]
MKVAVVFLCLFPLVFGALIGNILDSAELHKLVDAVVEKYGSNTTEQQCETECKVLFTNDILDLGCDFACRGIQTLIIKLHSR